METVQDPGMAQREKDDNEALEHPVTVDGHKLKLRDIFSDAYAARDFRTKLKLLHSKAGGEADSMPSKEEISDELFGGRKQEKNPVGMDGE